MPEWSNPKQEVDWSSVSHAYGPATEVPGLLRAIRSGSQEVRQRAYSDLVELLVDQGAQFEASATVAPYLIEIVADPAAPDRFAACQVLATIAVGDESSWLNDPVDPSWRRSEVKRRAQMSLKELEEEHRAWINSAPNEKARDERARAATWGDVEGERDAERWAMEAYDAVRAGVPVYVRALEAPDKAVRLYAAYLLAWFPEDVETISPALTRLIREEPNPIVAATACVAAGLAGARGDEALIDALSARRGSGNRGESWSAVLGLARVVPHPDRALVRDLYSCLFGATGPVPHWPFLEGDMSSMAALTIRGLEPDVAHDRISVLVQHVVNAGADTDFFMLLNALLDAAFPDGPVSDGAGFDELTSDQQMAVLALLESNVLRAGPMVPMLLGRYHLPRDEAGLRAWSGR
ncbi:hypothetical protein [Micromonospora sp. DPT]|uniref:hypothetical protein n=1 Tax=Micromonospora sp. DPT TaxID=3142975 RepID=UPI00320A62E3